MKHINKLEQKIRKMQKVRGKRRAQFTLIAAILISGLVITIAYSASQLSVFQQNFRYQPAKEIITEITSDLDRSLTHALSLASNKYYETGHNITQAKSTATEYLFLWQRSVVSSHSNLGLQMKIQPPGGGGATYVQFDLKWNSNPGWSKALTVFELNATNYGLTGWASDNTLARVLSIDDASFASNYYTNSTSFEFKLTDDRNNPITDLTIENLTVSMKPLGSEWKNSELRRLQYIGAGEYRVELAPYFTLQGLQKNVTVVTPSDGIYVAAYQPIPPYARVTLDSRGVQGGPHGRGTINLSGRDYTDTFPDDSTLLIPPAVQRVEFTITEAGKYFHHWTVEGDADLMSASFSDNPILVNIRGNTIITAYYDEMPANYIDVIVTKTATQLVEVGEPIIVKANVTNTGNAAATLTSVNDDSGALLTCAPTAIGGSLAAGALTMCEGFYTAPSTPGYTRDNVTAVLTRQAQVATASAIAITNVVKVGVTVTKIASSIVQVGGTIFVSAIVTNTGTSAANFTSISDYPPLSFTCDVAIGQSLNPGDSTICTASYTAPSTAGIITDNVTAVLTDQTGASAAAWAVATTEVIDTQPLATIDISVTKTTNSPVLIGGTIRVTAIVTNTGTVAANLTSVIDDPQVALTCSPVAIGELLEIAYSTICNGVYTAPSIPGTATDTVTAVLTDQTVGVATGYATATTEVVTAAAALNTFFYSRESSGLTQNLGSIIVQGSPQILPYTASLPAGPYSISYTPPDGYYFVSWEVNDWTRVQLDNTLAASTTVHVLQNGGAVTAIYARVPAVGGGGGGGGEGGPYSELYIAPDDSLLDGLDLKVPDYGFISSQTSHGSNKAILDLYLTVPPGFLIRFDGPAKFYVAASSAHSEKPMIVTIEYMQQGESSYSFVGQSDPVLISKYAAAKKPILYTLFPSNNADNPINSRLWGPGGTIHVRVEIEYDETVGKYGQANLFYGEDDKNYTLSYIEITLLPL